MATLSTITVAFVCVTASALLRLLLLLLGLLRLRSGRQRAGVAFFFSVFPFPFLLSPFLPLCLQPYHHREPVLAARHIRRRSRAVCKCGPLSTRIHQAFLHNDMCLFGTKVVSFSKCSPSNLIEGFVDSGIEYASSSCPFFGPSPHSRALCSSSQFSPLSLSTHFFFSLSLSLLLSSHLLLSLHLSIDLFLSRSS